MTLYEIDGYVQFTDRALYAIVRRYANLNAHYLGRYDIDAEVVGIIVDDARDMVAVCVATDLSPLFPVRGSLLDYTIVCRGDALIWV